jgi:small subunit ribosomal protein S6
MSRYELIYTVPAKYAETELQPVIDGITAGLNKLGVKIGRNDMVGKIKMAYPVAKNRHGYYVMVDLDLEGAKAADVNEMLRLHSDVIRHQLVVKNKKNKPLFKLMGIEDVDRERERIREVGREAKSRAAAAAAKPEAKKVEVDMADIDQKLDKIVEGNIV